MYCWKNKKITQIKSLLFEKKLQGASNGRYPLGFVLKYCIWLGQSLFRNMRWQMITAPTPFQETLIIKL